MKQAPLVENPELGSAPSQRGGNRRGQTPFDPPAKNYWKAFWKWTGIFSLLSIAGLLVYFNLTAHGRTTGGMIQEFVPAVWEAKQNPGLIFDNAGSDIVNILLIGRDVNWKIKKVYDPTRKIYAPMQVYDEEAPARSDTMIVVSLDRVRNVIHMVSLPRDARVQMPENDTYSGRAKLNAAHAYGGPDLLKQTIYDELGLTIHHYAVIRFEGFKELIDQVGGIEVDVIGALKRDGTRGDLVYDDNWGNLHINLKPGRQVLDGEKAHSYVRFRMDREGDPGRIKRQQQVMRALAKSLMNQPIYKIAPLVQEVRKQFKTDMGNAEIASAADFAKGIGDPSKIQPLTMFGIYGTRGSLILNKPKNTQLFHYIFGPTFDETRFLENSPWTRRDEMGEENNSSPGAKAILRQAGLIKGAPQPEAHTENSEISSRAVNDSSDVSARPSPDDSRLAVAEEDTPRRSARERRRRARSESTESSSARSSSVSTRRSTREQANTETPRERVELSVPDDEIRSSEEAAPARSESPIPEPESESTPAGGESPVPRVE